MVLKRFLTIIIMTMVSAVTAHAVVPGSFVYQGQIVKPNGKPLEAEHVSLMIEIYSPGAEECLLYQETHILNMSDSKGLFSIVVGSGTRKADGFYEDTSFLIDVFDNTLPVQTPTSCASVGTYTPASGDSRTVRLTFDAGSGPITVSQDHRVQSVPYAEHASKLDGLDSLDLVHINDNPGTHELSQANINTIFETANYTELLALIAGTSTLYNSSAPSSPPDNNGQPLQNVADPTNDTDAATKGYVDTNIGGANADHALIETLGAAETGHILVWDGSQWTAATPAEDPTKLPLAGGVMSGTIDMDNSNIVDIGNANIITNLDVGNNTTVGVDLSVGNNLTVTGGIGVTNGINSSGPIQLVDGNELRLGDADNSQYVGFTAPAVLGGNQIWVLPLADGTVGQVLQTNGASALSWANVALTDGVSGGQTFYGGTDAGDDLTLDSTAHATKGDVIIQPAGGNVGIGTTTPGELLHIVSSTEPTVIRMEADTDDNNENDNPYLWLSQDGGNSNAYVGLGGDAGNAFGGVLANTLDNAFIVSTYSSGANGSVQFATEGTVKMSILSNGDVGIGTTTPSGRLDVEGGDVFIGDAALTNTSADEDLKVKGNIEFDGILYGDGSGLTNLGASALATGSVGSDEIIDGSVSLIDMNSDSVNSAKIVDGSVSLADMNTDSVDSSKIVDGSVSLADMNNNSVDSSKIVDGSVSLADMNADSVNSANIVNGSVALVDMANNSVDSSKIVDGSVSLVDMNTDSVNSSKIVDGSVSLADMNADSVNSANIVNGSVALVDMANNSVDSSKIVDGSVSLVDMNADSVNSSKIVDGSVALADMANNSVDSSKIVNGSIAAIDLADDYVNVTGDAMTGPLTMNAQNQIRFADSDSSNYISFRAPATVGTNVNYIWPDADAPPPTPNNYVLSSDGSGNLTWAPPSSPADNMGNHTAGLNLRLNDFWLSNDGGNEGIRVDNSGNVGIGTGTMSSILTVNGTATATAFVGDGSGLTNVVLGSLAANSVNSSKIVDGSIAAADLNVGSVETVFLRSDTSDTINGTLTATAFISTSDRRLKKNIETIDGLDAILRMRGVRFDWRKDGTPEIGLIAQEVEAVMPELVVTNPETGIKAVKYANIVSPLIESTKEIYGMCQASQDDIKIHDRRIASLEKAQSDMEEKVQSLELENRKLKKQLGDMESRLQRLESLIKER